MKLDGSVLTPTPLYLSSHQQSLFRRPRVSANLDKPATTGHRATPPYIQRREGLLHSDTDSGGAGTGRNKYDIRFCDPSVHATGNDAQSRA